MLDAIRRSSTPTPKTELIDGIWDFKEWMEPYLANIQNHSKYLCFRFSRNASGIVELHYKKFSDMPWEPENEGLKVLSVRMYTSKQQ